MEDKWRKEYDKYMNRHLADTIQGLDEPNNIHHCPNCGEYLWADKHHMSYDFCVYCGVNLKGKKLPFERI